MKKNITSIILFASLALFLQGCATHLTKASSTPVPSTEKLGAFSQVEVKAVSISERFADNSANQKAMKKIDEMVFRDMRMIFPNLKRIEPGGEFSNSSEKTLQITLNIKEVKFIGGAARFWVGPIAGSSAVLMQATFKDSSTGQVIANPEFYRDAGAYAGSWSLGNTDNRMLEDIARDIINYTSLNR